MRKTFTFLICVILFLGSFLLPGYSQDGAAVLYDISASMRFKGNWKAVAEETILNILFGGGINASQWIITTSDQAFLNRIQQGQPLLRQNHFLLLLEFGVINPQKQFPYFQPPYFERIQSLSQSRQNLVSRFPKSCRDQWTHKELAKAVARDYMLQEGGIRRWYTLLLSDLKADYVRLPHQADSLATSYPATVNDTPAKLTLTYRADNQLKLIVQDVRYISTAPPPRRQLELMWPKGTIKPGSDGEPLVFKWRSVADVERYLVRVFHGNQIFEQLQARTNFVNAQKDYSAGEYQWEVMAIKTSKEKIRSERVSFKLVQEGRSILTWGVLVAIVIILLYILVNYLTKKQKSERRKR